MWFVHCPFCGVPNGYRRPLCEMVRALHEPRAEGGETIGPLAAGADSKRLLDAVMEGRYTVRYVLFVAMRTLMISNHMFACLKQVPIRARCHKQYEISQQSKA